MDEPYSDAIDNIDNDITDLNGLVRLLFSLTECKPNKESMFAFDVYAAHVVLGIMLDKILRVEKCFDSLAEPLTTGVKEMASARQ